MNLRNVAVVVFTDGKDIVVQERGKHSKTGEQFGFWGGGVEEGEEKESAIKRELLEEIGFIPEKLDYWGEYSFTGADEGKYKGWIIHSFVFVSPITPELLNTQILEGKSMYKMSLDMAIEGKGFPIGATQFLKAFKK
jgi:8-oxo-dGTP pyrophosphatase MutT (NUDIX family)